MSDQQILGKRHKLLREECDGWSRVAEALEKERNILLSKIYQVRLLAEMMPHTAAPNLDPSICANACGSQRCDRCDLLAILKNGE